jgi:hypothetical protein
MDNKSKCCGAEIIKEKDLPNAPQSISDKSLVCTKCGCACEVAEKPVSKCQCGHEREYHQLKQHHSRGNCLKAWCYCAKFHPCVEPEKCTCGIKLKSNADLRITNCHFAPCPIHPKNDNPKTVTVKPEPPFDTGHPYDQSDLSEQLVPITAPDEPASPVKDRIVLKGTIVYGMGDKVAVYEASANTQLQPYLEEIKQLEDEVSYWKNLYEMDI